jgi:hypothetical protein
MRPTRALTAGQIVELRRLLDLLADCAGEASRAFTSGVTLPIGPPLEHLAILDQRMIEAWKRVRKLLD